MTPAAILQNFLSCATSNLAPAPPGRQHQGSTDQTPYTEHTPSSCGSGPQPHVNHKHHCTKGRRTNGNTIRPNARLKTWDEAPLERVPQTVPVGDIEHSAKVPAWGLNAEGSIPLHKFFVSLCLPASIVQTRNGRTPTIAPEAALVCGKLQSLRRRAIISTNDQLRPLGDTAGCSRPLLSLGTPSAEGTEKTGAAEGTRGPVERAAGGPRCLEERANNYQRSPCDARAHEAAGWTTLPIVLRGVNGGPASSGTRAGFSQEVDSAPLCAVILGSLPLVRAGMPHPGNKLSETAAKCQARRHGNGDGGADSHMTVIYPNTEQTATATPMLKDKAF
ncbi:hypothetical protein SKAU_G00079730 [Synaphobranchus kaupii]|uniref:Uncharacterized protein n=1 Tax=Synaphobranchus kaupii TaxID=118154 RepID=A0A9Q1FVE6_SYNKA|nr:hypothetical protein SKAU_G00079730 [Synaphobranchus kaupii]